jgi:hypothetical protein
VVAPHPLEAHRTKGQKTDRLDARGLLAQLDSYLREVLQLFADGLVRSPDVPGPLASRSVQVAPI